MNSLNKSLKILLLLIGILVVIISSGKVFNIEFGQKAKTNNKAERLHSENSSDIFKDIIEDYSYHTYNEENDSYTAYNSSKELLCYLVFTSPSCDSIEGFGGNMNLAIILDIDYKVKDILVLENSETKSWIKKLENIGFLDSWNGFTVKEALQNKVDAISGATFTSNAIIGSVKHRLSLFVPEVELAKSLDWIAIIELIASFIVLLFAIFCFFVPTQSKKLRLILLIATIGILGFWQGDFLSMALLHNWLINGLSIKAQIFLFIVLIVSILLPIITNKAFYCQYLCPFGAAQELVGKVNNKKLKIGKSIINILKSLKFIFLFVIAVFLVVAIDINLESLEPFSAFKFKYASLGVLIMAVIIMFLSIFINKPWCRFLCPTGALLSMLRGNIKKIKHRKYNISILVIILLSITVCVLAYFLIKSQKNENIKASSDMDMINLIHSRKSVRNFTDQPVEKEQLEILVKAGMAAPSARNLRPWKFIIIQDKAIMNLLSESLANARMLKDAQAAIVVCGDLTKAYTDVDEAYWVQDCCAATENILLAAEAIGLGAVWTAAYPYKERIEPIKKYLELPDHIIPLNVIPIGYSTGKDKPKDKWAPENVRWEKW